MTNLDCIIETFDDYKNNGITTLSCYICGKRLGLTGMPSYDHCAKHKCTDCVKDSLIWFKEPYKPKIKLTKWEYDLLSIQKLPKDVNTFELFGTYMNMKEKGHFKGITDTSMTLEEILKNCEVTVE